jgi:hypothetical protein
MTHPPRTARDDHVMGAPSYSNAVRIGYAPTSTHLQDHQLQLDALAAADCREVTWRPPAPEVSALNYAPP